MNITLRVGQKTHPVKETFRDYAEYYDINQDERVTLSEIEERSANMPDGMTVDTRDFAVGIRSQMAGLPSPYVNDYPSVKEIDRELVALAKEHKGKAEVVTIGESLEGRPIKALRVSQDVKAAGTDDKPSVIVTGNLHAREWTTNGAVAAAAEKLLTSADQGPLENLEVWFVPNANPDGYHHSRQVDPMWRKNTWRNEQGEVKGVDLNRNFSHNYRMPGDTTLAIQDDVGASDSENNDTFRGMGPLSEPEAQTIKNLMDQEENAVGLLDVHGFGRMILISDGDYDVSRKEYDSIAGEMNKAIKRVDYEVMTDEGLYPTTGGLSTYADSQGLVGITMEIGTSFQPDPKERDGIVDRASDGIVEFVRQMEERAQKLA